MRNQEGVINIRDNAQLGDMRNKEFSQPRGDSIANCIETVDRYCMRTGWGAGVRHPFNPEKPVLLRDGVKLLVVPTQHYRRAADRFNKKQFQ